MSRMFPLVEFSPIELPVANRFLVAHAHKMGPCNRPMNGTLASGGGRESHGLFHDGQLVGVTVTCTLAAARVADRFTRDDSIELARLCADRPGLCRVLLRLWRLFVFDQLADPIKWAVSYQDASLHTGDTYRFDGWKRIAFSHSGTDRRSGRPGRDKWIWACEKAAILDTMWVPR